MKKLSVLFLIFTVMLPTISWGGVVDGKSIICHCIDCNHEEKGWKFESGKVISVFEVTIDDKVSIKEEGWGNYSSDENEIRWSKEGMGKRLNRETLILTDTYLTPFEKSSCEIFQSLPEFNKEWETEPPHLNWSSAMFRKRRTDNDEQTTEAGRDYHEVEAS